MKFFHYHYKVFAEGEVVEDDVVYCTENTDVDEQQVTDWMAGDIEDSFYKSEILELDIKKTWGISGKGDKDTNEIP